MIEEQEEKKKPKAYADGIPVFCAHTEIAKASTLIPHPQNPNQHPAEQIKRLAKIIEATGWRYPIKVSIQSGRITSGEGRYLAARHMNWVEVPVDRQNYPSPEAEKNDVLADNRLAELSERNKTLEARLIEDIKAAGGDIELTGYTIPEAEQILKEIAADTTPTEDEVPEPPKNPITKPGDLWKLGAHRVLCGDATKGGNVKRLMAGQVADLMVTDPPYGVAYQSQTKKNAISGDLSQAAIPLIFAVALDHMTPDARIYIFGGSHNWNMYARLFDHYLRAEPRPIVWVKEGFILRHNNYHSQFEMVYFGWKGLGGGQKFWFGDRKQADVWQVKRDQNREHPTQKPVEVCAIPIRNSAPPAGIVLDPFLGSGSTLIAAQVLGRKCFGVELEPKFCDVIVKRWEAFSGGKAEREASTAA